MINLSRRALLVGDGAAAVSCVMPAFAQQAADMPSVRMVKANGINLAVYEAGSGPPIVLLRGFPGLAFNWRRQIPAIAAADYRVIVPDLRGYGQSDRNDQRDLFGDGRRDRSEYFEPRKHASPTQSEAIKHAADAYNRTQLTPIGK